MYERTFGTDWETLENRDEALRRAFALGVAECFGEDHPDELERLTAALGTSYDRQFLDLAYRKGIQYVRQLEPHVDDERQLRTYLADELTEIDPLELGQAEPDFEADANDDGTGLPDSLQGYRIDTRPDDSRERTRRPSFLE